MLSSLYQARRYVYDGFCELLHGETATRASSPHQAHPTLHRRHSRLQPCLPKVLQH
jgi:hypothetical protein